MAKTKKSSKRTKKASSASLLSEPIDSIVTPWLLVTLLLVTGLFVVLQVVT